jgi:hypothetical protein
MMNHFFPTFTNVIECEAKNSPEAINFIANELIMKGGTKTVSDSNEIKLEIPANNLKFGFTPYVNILSIRLCYSADINKIKMIIFRSSEYKISFRIFILSFFISILSIIQKNELSGILLPVFVYVFSWFFSIISAHPAHRILKEIANSQDPLNLDTDLKKR